MHTHVYLYEDISVAERITQQRRDVDKRDMGEREIYVWNDCIKNNNLETLILNESVFIHKIDKGEGLEWLSEYISALILKLKKVKPLFFKKTSSTRLLDMDRSELDYGRGGILTLRIICSCGS
jgi:hypothetical protein